MRTKYKHINYLPVQNLFRVAYNRSKIQKYFYTLKAARNFLSSLTPEEVGICYKGDTCINSPVRSTSGYKNVSCSYSKSTGLLIGYRSSCMVGDIGKRRQKCTYFIFSANRNRKRDTLRLAVKWAKEHKQSVNELIKEEKSARTQRIRRLSRG